MPKLRLRQPKDAPELGELGKRRLAGVGRSIAGIPPMRPWVRIYARTVRRVEDAIYDRGTETAEFERTLDHFHPEHVHYEPSAWRVLRRALPRSAVGPEDVFLDIGAGKGRVMLAAARRYAFKRVVGVEIAPELVEAARANLAAQADRLRCREVEVVRADATKYDIPDDVTVVYMYLPMVGESFARAIARIEESLDRSPRHLRLLFCCPLLEDRVLSSGRFRLTGSTRIFPPFRHVLLEIRTYETVPAPAPRA